MYIFIHCYEDICIYILCIHCYEDISLYIYIYVMYIICIHCYEDISVIAGVNLPTVTMASPSHLSCITSPGVFMFTVVLSLLTLWLVYCLCEGGFVVRAMFLALMAMWQTLLLSLYCCFWMCVVNTISVGQEHYMSRKPFWSSVTPNQF